MNFKKSRPTVILLLLRVPPRLRILSGAGFLPVVRRCPSYNLTIYIEIRALEIFRPQKN